jgi:hypothetical protein
VPRGASAARALSLHRRTGPMTMSPITRSDDVMLELTGPQQRHADVDVYLARGTEVVASASAVAASTADQAARRSVPYENARALHSHVFVSRLPNTTTSASR